jgi:four helix bundle protein
MEMRVASVLAHVPPHSRESVVGAALERSTLVKQVDLKERTLAFALEVTAFCRRMQSEWPQRRLADQLFRSATSVAANYHAATRARSRREFLSKLGLVAEEAEETVFWLEFARRAGFASAERADPLIGEARQLLAIFTSSLKTVAANMSSRDTR